jgi:hypothetical protein
MATLTHRVFRTSWQLHTKYEKWKILLRKWRIQRGAVGSRRRAEVVGELLVTRASLRSLTQVEVAHTHGQMRLRVTITHSKEQLEVSE